MQLDRLEVKSDARGSLVEAFKLPNDGQVFYIVVKPHESRGNHYHLRKTETFLVISGGAEITVRDRESGDLMKANLIGQTPITVRVVPNHTHSITATDEGAFILAWASEQFNETDPDTYPEEI